MSPCPFSVRRLPPIDISASTTQSGVTIYAQFLYSLEISRRLVPQRHISYRQLLISFLSFLFFKLIAIGAGENGNHVYPQRRRMGLNIEVRGLSIWDGACMYSRMGGHLLFTLLCMKTAGTSAGSRDREHSSGGKWLAQCA